MKRQRITVLGAGSWGTALAVLLQRNEHCVTLWGRVEDGIEEVARKRTNERYLPRITIPSQVNVTSDLEMALLEPNMVVLAVPSQAVRTVLKQSECYLNNEIIIVNTAKGLELGTNYRMSQVVRDLWGDHILRRFVVLSGPSHAEEVGLALPTAVVVASNDLSASNKVQDAFMTRDFRVYTNEDLIGVEMGGSLKNIIALATGISGGLGFGDNTRAALVTRGLAEITRMGTYFGAQAETFAGLSGLGDLVVTCNSQHSRNARAGRLIGVGYSREQVIQEIGMVVEGISTTSAAHKMAAQNGIPMPITSAVYGVLFEGLLPGPSVDHLMQRDKKDED